MSVLPEMDAVLFDLDETLITQKHSFQELGYATFDAFAHRMPGVSRERFWDTFWRKALDNWFMMVDGALEPENARIYPYINTLRALRVDEALAPELAEQSERLLIEGTSLLPAALPVLGALRDTGKTVGIVTNGFPGPQRGKLARHGLEDHVDFVVVSGEVGAHKPNPEIFRKALEIAGCEPHRAVYVGDQPEVDVLGAESAGMHAVLISLDGRESVLPGAGRARPETRRLTQLEALLPLLGMASPSF